MDDVINPIVFMYVNINGKPVPFITDAAIVMCVISAIIIGVLWFITRELKEIPSGAQNIAEIYVSFLNNFMQGLIGKAYKIFTPYVGMLLIFIALSNMVGIFDVIPSGKRLATALGNPQFEGIRLALEPPTKNFNVTLCLALSTMFIYVVSEFRFKGVRGWSHGFYRPSPVFGFVKILDYVMRPISLCLRLFGNIMGGFIVMHLLYSFVPLIIPGIVGIYFDLFDGALQAFVFMVLTSIYFGEAVETEIEDE